MRLVFSMHLYLVGNVLIVRSIFKDVTKNFVHIILNIIFCYWAIINKQHWSKSNLLVWSKTFIIVAKGGDQILEKQKNNHNKGALLFMNICDKILSFINIAQQKQTGTQLFFNEFSQRLYQLWHQLFKISRILTFFNRSILIIQYVLMINSNIEGAKRVRKQDLLDHLQHLPYPPQENPKRHDLRPWANKLPWKFQSCSSSQSFSRA